MSAEDVLKVPMQDTANGATIGEYLTRLLLTLWREEEGFSGKRPFGNSGWQFDVYDSLTVAGLMDAEDLTAGDALVESAIRSLSAVGE